MIPRKKFRAAASSFLVFVLPWLFVFSQGVQAAPPRFIGDVDNNGILDLVDLSKLRKHVWNVTPLSAAALPYADVNGDGVINEDDAAALIRLINELDKPKTLPLAVVRDSSPQNGEDAVSNNRRNGIIVRFSLPMRPAGSTFDSTSFYAEIVDPVSGKLRKLVSSAQLSGDGTKAALLVDAKDKIPSGARVDVTLKGDALKDLAGRLLDGDGNGSAGGNYKFHFSSEKLVAVKGTVITGTVFASEKVNGADLPLKGVLVRVAGSETINTTTDANGRFSLNCPAGRFFAEVDGRKVINPNYNPASGEAYYPFVIKAWEAVAGSKLNLAAGTGVIYLPKIPAGALQTVSPGTITTISAVPSVTAGNANMAGVALTVPAGALRNPDGSAASGKVGMAPVAPDRLPEPLGQGLKFPLVITIQTDGAAIFDQPVPVKFPNLPDPVTKVKLKPGEKSALWSFNHDSGEWEMQGPMTVTNDGNFVTTDPGVGVRQPGWHGVLPGSQGVGPKLPAPSQEPDPSVRAEVDDALRIVAEHSLFVRDAFLKLGDMRPLAVDLQQMRDLMNEINPLVASYKNNGYAPGEWRTWWISDRIGKLKPSFEKLFPAVASAGGKLSDDVAVLRPLLEALKTTELERLKGFNQKVSANLSLYGPASQDLADANAKLFFLLDDWKPRMDKLAGPSAALLAQRPNVFLTATNVLLPGFNAPKPSQDQVMAALEQFAKDFEPVFQLIDPDYAVRLRELQDKMSTYLRCAGTLATAGRALPTKGYWMIQSAGEQRNRSNSIGNYRMVLPPNREFALTYVDPTTLQIGAYVGFSNGNGIVTDLYGPALAPIPSTVNLSNVVLTAGSQEVICDTKGLALGMTVSGIPSGASANETVSGVTITAVSSDRITLSKSITMASAASYSAQGAAFALSASASIYGKDSDGDLLVDVMEKVVGTYATAGTTQAGVKQVDPKNSDGQGLSDYRALLAGEDPLNGLAASTGVVFTDQPSKTGYKSVDVDTGDDLLLSAESNGSTGGLVVYDIQNKLVPLKKGVFPVTSSVSRVRYGQGKSAVLVLGGTEGVAIVDVSDPGSSAFAQGDASLVKTYPMNAGESANSAVLVGDILAVGVNRSGSTTAEIRLFDKGTGAVLMGTYAGVQVSDLISNGTVIYALSKSATRQGEDWSWWQQNSVVYAGDLSSIKSGNSLAKNAEQAAFKPYDVRAWEYSGENGRLALAKGRLFVVRASGLTSFKTDDPLRLQREGDVFLPDRQNSLTQTWSNVIFDGSEKDGKATFLAALGFRNSGGDVFRYQFGTADKFNTNGTSTPSWWNNTPSAAAPTAVFAGGRYSGKTDDFQKEEYIGQAASKVKGMAIAGGILYAADQEFGIFAVNYESFDTLQQPPKFEGPILTNSPSPAQMAQKRFNTGDLISLRANVSDDVAVAAVKWYVNGKQAAVTSGYPWSYTLTAGTAGTSYQLEARVFDTGGNFASSGSLLFGVFADARPPSVTEVSPVGGNPSVSEIRVKFSEPMNRTAGASLPVQISYSGSDFIYGARGSAQDITHQGELSFNPDGKEATVATQALAFPLTSVRPGRYKVTLPKDLADVAGNQLKGNDPSGSYVWYFAVADANEWIGKDGLGGDGVWNDDTHWKNGFVPFPHEKVRFPSRQSGSPRVVLGGRTSFVATDGEGYPLPYLPSGETVFTSVFKKSSGSNWFGSSQAPPKITPRQGMNVKGRYIAPGTTVKAVSSVDDAYDVTNQKRTIQIVLNEPIGSAGGRLEWDLHTPVSLAGVEVLGATTFVDLEMTVTGAVDLRERTSFAGESALVAGTLKASGPGLLAVAWDVEFGSLLVGGATQATSGKGLLRLPAGINLGSDLEIENAEGFDKTELQVYSAGGQGASASMQLGGHRWTIRAGNDSLVKLGALRGASELGFVGGGTLGFAWKNSATQQLRVSAAKMTLPSGVQLAAPGSGTVEILSPKFINSGSLGVATGGSLAVYNYDPSSGGAKTSAGTLDIARKHQIALRSGALPVSGTERNSMAMRSSVPANVLWTWGDNSSGQLGNGSLTAQISPGTVSSGSWNTVSSIGSAMLGIREDGVMYAWGDNGRGTFSYQNPVWNFWSNWSGNRYSSYTQGVGSLGIGSKERFVKTPVQVGDEWDWVDVRAHNDLWSSQYTNYNHPDLNGSSSSYYYYYTYYNSYGLYYALKSDGSLWRWSNYGSKNSSDNIYPARVGTSWAWTSLTFGGQTAYGIKADGTLWSWGAADGEPVQFGTSANWKSVVASRYSAFAINEDGELWSWGDNTFGELGIGGNASTPGRVDFGVQGGKCLKVVASDFYTFAIVSAVSQTSGSLYAWGKNDDGQLGNGSELDANSPRPVSTTVTDWTDVVAFGDMVIAKTSTGGLWAWGNNHEGKLGVGSALPRETSPKEIVHPQQKAWREVTIGGDFLRGRQKISTKEEPYYALAIHAVDRDGDMWAWGYNGGYNLNDYSYNNNYSGGALGMGTPGTWEKTPKQISVGTAPNLKW